MQPGERLEMDLLRWEVGPYHPALPGPFRLKVELDGEIIVGTDVERGFLHRGLEKILEAQRWAAVIPYAGRIDPEGAAFGELAVCLAVEEISGIAPTPRSRAIRVLVCELTRVSQHLRFVGEIARSVGAETVLHYVLRERERILDLFELLAGARHSLNYMRVGGVAVDVTEGVLERTREVVDQMRLRLKEYNDTISFNHAFLKRTASVGVIGARLVTETGLSGPNARASGVPFDARKSGAHPGYAEIDFKVVVGRGESGRLGDSHDRYLVRLREISESLDIIRQVVESLPDGPHADPAAVGLRVRSGEAYSRVETARGVLGCHLVSDGGDRPARVQFRTPSLATLAALPGVLTGCYAQDLPVVVASLDPSIAEADR